MRARLRVLLLAVIFAIVLVSPAQAINVLGGTPEQRADVYATLDAMQFPSVEWVESKVGNVHIEITDSYPPYWVTTLDSTDDFVVDIFSATAAGVAWPGNIRIHSIYLPGLRTFFREIVAHEFSHQVWFALIYVPGAGLEWKTRVEAGLTPDYTDWYQNYVESHAEQLRVAAWSNLYWHTPYPRTNLNLLGNTAVREFHNRWTAAVPPTTTTTLGPTTTTTVPPVSTTTTPTTGPPPTTTTTIERMDPFLDVDHGDEELWQASWWGKDSGIWWGYPNGHFEPYILLTHRHAALLVDRWLGIALPQWIFDYSPVTRGELRDEVLGLEWQEERWDETLLRSQMLRLQYRSVQ